ncbi:MAG TPA: metalloregulator ArsR/SmtB family transcription factor [Phycisphaerales bacterium]|nr:metalloregulator ArsR/SmtB family transcription factor [Phycisphaerales bacterium]
MKAAAPTVQLSDQLAVLSEPIRLRLLRLLEREELSVGELSRVVQLPQSTVSRHLKLLADAGWLLKRTEGTATLYRLVQDDLAAPLRALWAPVRQHLEASPDLAEDRRRLTGVLAERMSDSQAFFGRVAGEWDSVRGQLFGDRFTLQGLLALLPAGWVVADLGCGTGNISELLAPVVREVIAVDQSGPMLRAARRRLQGAANVTFVRAGLENLPIADGAVDAAICVLVLHHLQDPAAALREMARLLSPGGVALIIDMVEHDRTSYKHTMGHRWLGFPPEQMARWAREAGLAEPRTLRLPSHPDARGPALFACTATRPPAPRDRGSGGAARTDGAPRRLRPSRTAAPNPAHSTPAPSDPFPENA